MNWAKLLKDVRTILVLTQTEMANFLGVSFASVNRWENGHCEPTMKVKRKLKQICKDNNLSFESYFLIQPERK